MSRILLACLPSWARGPGLFLLCACSSQGVAPTILHFDRPVDIAFGCVGAFSGDSGDLRAFPMSFCREKYLAGGGDAGPDTPDASPDTPDAALAASAHYMFVLESSRGEVSIVSPAGQTSSFINSDPLSPGFSGVPVGRLPVEAATTADGCFVATANQGSCDLGVVDVLGAVRQRTGIVWRHTVNAQAGTLAARPAAMVTPPGLPFDVNIPACSPEPAGLVYVAFPGCDLVGVVDLASGDLIEGIRFPANGPPELTGPNATCPVECTELAAGAAVPVGPVTPGGAPTTLAMDPAGGSLYVGLANEPTVAMIGLDAFGLPTTLNTVALAGAQGVRRIVDTGDVQMGNDLTGAIFRFVYALGKDGTIRVADVTDPSAARECDTQIDPRQLRGIRDSRVLSCLPLGSFPRRAGAQGPGIRLPYGLVPAEMTVVSSQQPLDADHPAWAPTLINGTVLLVTAEHPVLSGARGVVFYVDVDDDNYPDFELDAPGQVELSKALPHTLRDGGVRRELLSDCAPSEDNASAGPVRMEGSPLASANLDLNQLLAPSWVAPDPDCPMGAVGCTDPWALRNLRFLPGVRRTLCKSGHGGRTSSVATFVLSNNAPPAEHERLFPDWLLVPNEPWTVAWEGPLGATGVDTTTNVGVDRSGADRSGGRVTVENQSRLVLKDTSAGFCGAGFELYDQITFLGCQTDFDCGVGEICFRHSDTPAELKGMCISEGHEDEVAALCRGLFVSARKYTAMDVKDDELVLASPPVVLGYEPLGGCTSNEQCTALREEQVADRQPAIPSTTRPTETDTSKWACGLDPSFGGERKCVRTCSTNSDCSLATVCQNGRCVQGPIAPPECFTGVMAYRMSARDAYVVKGERSGYRHNWIVEPATKECMRDVDASPLSVSRFGVDVPMCGSDDPLDFSPNVCRIDFDEPLAYCALRDSNGHCTQENPATSTRASHGVRIMLWGLTIELADLLIERPSAPGELYTPVPPGYAVGFDLAGGFYGFEARTGALVVGRVREAVDGTLWVVDSGDSDQTRGQVIQMTTSGSVLIQLR